MVRSLWTGASGMIAQQDAIDAISNNLSNVNTTGYKKETVEFKTLLYSKLQTKTTDANGDPKPVIGQVGAGVRTASITSRYTQGNLQPTGNTLDFAIEGNGFFQVQLDDGTVAYTRNGAFNLSMGIDGLTLCTTDGYPVIGVDGDPIVFAEGIDSSAITIDEEGRFWYRNADETIVSLEEQFALVQFHNPAGLLKLSGSLAAATEASGEARDEQTDAALKNSKVLSKYLEGSNVEAVDEMVNLIVAQRAYEMNSKVIQASDQMLQQANNLRG